jgi:hypothetical protein
VKPDVLDLIRPSTTTTTLYGSKAEVESLRFLEWFKFDALLMRTLWALADFRFADGVTAICEALETAGLCTSALNADDGLAVFVVLGELNELRYIDPYLLTRSEGKGDGEEGDSVLVELITTLATRFSLEEIYNMTPEFALLAWQRIREEIATDRNVMFYSTELGFDKKMVSKKGKYKLHPRRSPYTPLWVNQKVRVMEKEERAKQESHVPRFVSDPGKVIDGKTRKRLKDLNLFEQKGEENG